MNTRKIKPINFWQTDGTKQADTILLYNFHGYNFNGSDSIVSYKLGLEETFDTIDGEPQVKWTSLYENSVAIPDGIVQSWGSNDDPIFDYVVDQLNLEYDE